MDPMQRMQGQLERKVDQKVSQWTTGCVISVVMAVLGVCIITGLAGYVFWAARSETASGVGPAGPWGGGGGALGAPGWNGAAPFSCGGNDNVTFEGVTASLPGVTAVEAAGNCHVRLVNCNISAGTPISASGNAQVDIVGGSITGTANSINASGLAKINVSGAAVSGSVNRSGMARVTGVP